MRRQLQQSGSDDDADDNEGVAERGDRYEKEKDSSMDGGEENDYGVQGCASRDYTLSFRWTGNARAAPLPSTHIRFCNHCYG